jgi:hypothetical protein
MTTANQSTSNQRRENRVPSVFHAFVRANVNGRRIKLNTVTDNISPGGLYMRLSHQLARNTQLFVMIVIPNSVDLAVIGQVVRSENKGHGLTGIAVCFSQTRLLPLAFG